MFKKSRVWDINLHINISRFLFSYILGSFNATAKNIGGNLGWGDNQDTYVIIFSTIVFIGAVIGAAIASSLMNYYGRRKAIMITDWVIIIGSSLTAIPFTICFGIGRSILGIGAGLFMTIPSSFVNEVTPDEMIPETGPLIQISTVFGLLFVFGLALPLPIDDYENSSSNNWLYVIFLFPAMLSFYQFSYFLRVWVYDTPLWLFRNHRNEEAMQALSMIYYDYGLNVGLQRFSEINDSTNLRNETWTPSYLEIFTYVKYRKMVRIGITLGIIQPSSGVLVAILYSTSIFEDLDVGSFMSRVYTFIMAFVFLLACLVSIILLKRYGRISLLVSGQILLAVDLIGLGLLNSFFDFSGVFDVVGIIFLFIFFSFSLGSTLWVYCGEALIEKIIGISVGINLIVGGIISLAFPIVRDGLGIQYVYFYFGIFMAFGAAYCYFDLIETKGDTKPQVLNKIYYQ